MGEFVVSRCDGGGTNATLCAQAAMSKVDRESEDVSVTIVSSKNGKSLFD